MEDDSIDLSFLLSKTKTVKTMNMMMIMERKSQNEIFVQDAEAIR